MFEIRLISLAGLSPVGLPPNTNPYLVYLNPALNQRFGTLWFLLVQSAFQNQYSTGHLPTIVPYHFNSNLPSTDFDSVIVNDQMTFRYSSIGSAIDQLITTALFNNETGGGSPFLSEVYFNIGDNPHGDDPTADKIPDISVALFDPPHGVLGIGHNRTGRTIGSGPAPSPPYAGIGHYEPNPIDTVIFTEGDNIVSYDVSYDYISMNNSWVLSGGQFYGSDVVPIPLENPSSINEFGLKQTQQSLSNVVDPDVISTYVDTSITYFQRPIPVVTIKPDYTYATAHPVTVGDFVSINAPSLVNVIEDSNGKPISQQIGTQAFVARIRRIDIEWTPNNGEDITYTLTFPVIDVNLTTAVGNTLQQMYTAQRPMASTTMSRLNQQISSSLHNSENGFMESRPQEDTILVNGSDFNLNANWSIVHIPAIVKRQPTENNNEDVLIFGFWVSVSTTDPTVSDVVVSIQQPDGLVIFDSVVPTNTKINVLSLLNKTRRSNGELVSNLSGDYIVTLSNVDSGSITYTVYSEYSFVLNPSAATKAISVSEIALTQNNLDPARNWIYRAPFIA
jgi:hypothetical protein